MLNYEMDINTHAIKNECKRCEYYKVFIQTELRTKE